MRKQTGYTINVGMNDGVVLHAQYVYDVLFFPLFIKYGKKRYLNLTIVRHNKENWLNL